MRSAYLDVTCGIAGDMFLASLLDAGCSVDALRLMLGELALEGEFEIHLSRVPRGALMGTHLDVRILRTDHTGHGRTYSDIVELIRTSRLPDRVQQDAVSVFTALGFVEAYLHGTSIEKVHFHEVGAIDSIVDIVGACAALYLLDVQEVYSSPVTDGYGLLRCDHGLLPIPAPATLELLKGIPLLSCDVPYELVTPTGAALLRHFCKGFGLRPGMIVGAIGYGAGRRDFPQRPNLLRVTIGELIEGPGAPGQHIHQPALHPHTHGAPHSHTGLHSPHEEGAGVLGHSH